MEDIQRTASAMFDYDVIDAHTVYHMNRKVFGLTKKEKCVGLNENIV